MAQNPLHGPSLLEADKTKVRHMLPVRLLLAKFGTLVADVDVGYLAVLPEQIAQVILRAFVRQVAYKQPLPVRKLDLIFPTRALPAANSTFPVGRARTAARCAPAVLRGASRSRL